MNRKLWIFCLGFFALSFVWVQFIDVVSKKQAQNQKESTELQLKLAQTTLERLYSVSAHASGVVKSPAVFLMRAENTLDMQLKDTYQSPSLTESLSFMPVKMAFRDLSNKPQFFVVDFGESGVFLVRRKLESQESILEFTGFPINFVLNAIGYDLGKKNWFLLDSQSNVLASHALAYVGQTYTLGEDHFLKAFKVGGSKFKLAVVKPQAVSASFFNFFGVLGLFLMSFALYRLTANGAEESKATSDLDLEDVEVPLPTDSNSYELQSEMEMVDFTGAKNSVEQEAVDYGQFLMENPVLGDKESGKKSVQKDLVPPPPAFGIEEKIVEDVEKPALEKGAQDWLQLAENLSKSIDQFTDDMKKRDSETKGESQPS